MEKKLRKIRLLILDVDGVLTDSRIILGDNLNNNEEFKNFNVKDGLGLKLLQKLGIRIAIITGKTSNIVTRRMNNLGIKDVYQGQANKIKAYKHLIDKYNFTDESVAYMGDDLPDLPLLCKVGFAIAPNDAHDSIKKYVDYICDKKGGKGAVREICDVIYNAQGLKEQLINDFLSLGEANDYICK